ncbi:nucleotidyltransferase domain-containing protein [Myxococcota bacterium]|nr:nucleotidyltransferase domain-containing protein [Myxococcota bacterium]
MPPHITPDMKRIAEFCRRRGIERLELFGSVLRGDFGPDSDVDVLVSLKPEARWSLRDHVEAEDELAGILGRKVDLVSRRAIEASHNWIRKEAILGSAELLHAAG